MKDIAGIGMMLVVLLMIASFLVSGLSTMSSNAGTNGTFSNASNAGVNFIGHQTPALSGISYAVAAVCVIIFVIAGFKAMGGQRSV